MRYGFRYAAVAAIAAASILQGCSAVDRIEQRDKEMQETFVNVYIDVKRTAKPDELGVVCYQRINSGNTLSCVKVQP